MKVIYFFDLLINNDTIIMLVFVSRFWSLVLGRSRPCLISIRTRRWADSIKKCSNVGIIQKYEMIFFSVREKPPIRAIFFRSSNFQKSEKKISHGAEVGICDSIENRKRGPNSWRIPVINNPVYPPLLNLDSLISPGYPVSSIERPLDV